MSDRETRPDQETASSDAAREAARRRRLAKVFGDVLPDDSRDERSDAWGESGAGRDDDWFRNQVPPHHG